MAVRVADQVAVRVASSEAARAGAKVADTVLAMAADKVVDKVAVRAADTGIAKRRKDQRKPGLSAGLFFRGGHLRDWQLALSLGVRIRYRPARAASRGGRRLRAPQVFDLLDYLIRNRERVVSKDDQAAGGLAD